MSGGTSPAVVEDPAAGLQQLPTVSTDTINPSAGASTGTVTPSTQAPGTPTGTSSPAATANDSINSNVTPGSSGSDVHIGDESAAGLDAQGSVSITVASGSGNQGTLVLVGAVVGAVAGVAVLAAATGLAIRAISARRNRITAAPSGSSSSSTHDMSSSIHQQRSRMAHHMQRNKVLPVVGVQSRQRAASPQAQQSVVGHVNGADRFSDMV